MRRRPGAVWHLPARLSRPRPFGHALAVIGRASGPGRATIGRDSGTLVPGARHVYVGAGRKAKTPADADGRRCLAVDMEWDGQQLSARPALETEGLRYLHVTGESPRATGSYRQLTRAPPCSVGRPLLRARRGLGRPGEAWPASGWRRTQVREGPGTRAVAVREWHFSGRRRRASFCRILYAKQALPSCGDWDHSALGIFLQASRHPTPNPYPAPYRPPRPPLSISS